MTARQCSMSRKTRPERRGPARDPWIREQESVKCRRCGAEPGRQCVAGSGAFCQQPHLERYLDAGGVPTERTTFSSAAYSRNKQRIFDHYGRACACCGSGERLTIDHIKGDGAEHRETMGLGSKGGASDKFYRWLIKNGFPEGFQTLCMPCNVSKAGSERCRMHDNICPACLRPFDDDAPATVKPWARRRKSVALRSLGPQPPASAR